MTASVPVVVSASQAAPLEQIRSLVVDSVTSDHSRRAYGKAVDDFLSWYAGAPRPPLSKAVVQEYRSFLQDRQFAPSTINVRLAAIRKLVAEAAENGLLDPVLAAGIASIRGVRQTGVRTGNWLSREEARELLLAPNPETLQGIRDRALLGFLIGCGLRRSEAAGLQVSQLAQREARWVVLDLVGKGSRRRTVPVPNWVVVLVRRWLTAAGITEGNLFRAVSKGGRIRGVGMTERAVWWVVVRHAEPLGHSRLAPHDLRRTCAKLCRAAGGDLEQIQFLLGHATIQTTERYLGTRQNLSNAVNDHLGIEID